MITLYKWNTKLSSQKTMHFRVTTVIAKWFRVCWRKAEMCYNSFITCWAYTCLFLNLLSQYVLQYFMCKTGAGAHLLASLLEKLWRYTDKCLWNSDKEWYKYASGNITFLLNIFAQLLDWTNSNKCKYLLAKSACIASGHALYLVSKHVSICLIEILLVNFSIAMKLLYRQKWFIFPWISRLVISRKTYYVAPWPRWLMRIEVKFREVYALFFTAQFCIYLLRSPIICNRTYSWVRVL